MVHRCEPGYTNLVHRFGVPPELPSRALGRVMKGASHRESNGMRDVGRRYRGADPSRIYRIFWSGRPCASSTGEGKVFRAEEVLIREYHRFEGVSDPDDLSIVYAIESQTGTRGILVDAFGVYSFPSMASGTRQLLRRPVAHRIVAEPSVGRGSEGLPTGGQAHRWEAALRRGTTRLLPNMQTGGGPDRIRAVFQSHEHRGLRAMLALLTGITEGASPKARPGSA